MTQEELNRILEERDKKHAQEKEEVAMLAAQRMFEMMTKGQGKIA